MTFIWHCSSPTWILSTDATSVESELSPFSVGHIHLPHCQLFGTCMRHRDFLTKHLHLNTCNQGGDVCQCCKCPTLATIRQSNLLGCAGYKSNWQLHCLYITRYAAHTDMYGSVWSWLPQPTVLSWLCNMSALLLLMPCSCRESLFPPESVTKLPP